MKRHYYNYGLPFSKPLDLNLDLVKKRVVKDNKAGMIIIDGGVGEGKTTIAVHVADYINGGYQKKDEENYKIVFDLFIDFKKQIGTGGEEFIKKLRVCYGAGIVVIIYDESGDFNRRGALTKFNAMLNRIFETYRAFKIVVILCLPSFKSLDNSLIEKGIPRLLIHVYDRNNSYGNFKLYSSYRMHYLLKKMKELVVPQFAYEQVDPNMIGHFLDLTEKRSKELDKFSISGKLDILDSAEVHFKGLLSYEDISHRLNRSVVWVKKKIYGLKIPYKKIYNNRRYFESYVLERLGELMEGK